MPESLLSWASGLAQGIFLMVVAPMTPGLLAFCAAMCQGRRRSLITVLQPYRELARLCRQRSVRAQTSSWLFVAAPTVLLVAYGSLLFATPWLKDRPLLRIDLITVLYLMALARFTFSLAGLDTAAPFGALGGSREMFLHLQTEIGMAFFIAAVALNRGILDLVDLSAAQRQLGAQLWFKPDLVLLAIALAVISLYEAGRVPVDNPTTELELTMAHEAIAGEYAGRDLALIRWANAIKSTFLLILFTDLFPLPAWQLERLLGRGGLSWFAWANGSY